MEQDELLKKSIDEAYFNLTNPSSVYDIKSLAQKSNLINSTRGISEIYENAMVDEFKKTTGSFYTDKPIIRYILKNTLDKVDLAESPFLKILDPSCGSGYFLIEAYEILKEKFITNLDKINLQNPGLCLNIENIHNHIIEHNLYGADLDPYGVKLACIMLMLKSGELSSIPNILCCDSIICWEDCSRQESVFRESKFDLIIGNPPYIGHKKVSGEYRRLLSGIYNDVFRDKADISFCFIKSSIDRLVDGGRLCFITSRYFMESPSGKAIRSFIKNNCIIEKIVDFYGVRIMKGISIDPVIVIFQKSRFGVHNTINVLKAERSLKALGCDDVFCALEEEDKSYFNSFIVYQHELSDDGWTLLGSRELKIIRKIENSFSGKLSDVCTSFQGIITGCDKAFIVDDNVIQRFGIEKDILKPWIKGRCINKYKVNRNNLYIIYSDLINNEDYYKNSISYIAKHRQKLDRRRECIKGVRRWYELQWGREQRLFDMKKIVFPYKSSCNRFALDEGSYSSADVYGMYIKKEFESKLSYEFLMGILNSKLYEFYFKSFGKKLGDNLYDYYPNTVMRLIIPNNEDRFISKGIKSLLSTCDENSMQKIMLDIDKRIYDIFNICKEEIEIIEGSVTKS